MKHILVTGGAGFIGSNFIKYILNKYPKYYVINIDLLTYASNLENLNEIENNKNYIFKKGDICDNQFINQIFDKYSITDVINFAAESHVDRSIENPEIFVKTNVLGTVNLLNIAKEKWGYPIFRENTKFIQVSTDEVYGSIKNNKKFSEESNLSPNNPYSASKASADLIVMSYYKTYKMPINITRSSNNYGPNQNREKLIPLMIYNTINNLKLPVYGDGLNIRDWIHVYDNCMAIDLVLHNGEVGEVYNIGANNEKSNIEITKAILENMNKDESLIEFVKDRLGHDRRYAVNNDKIVNDFKFKPKYEFKEGLFETIKWYKNKYKG